MDWKNTLAGNFVDETKLDGAGSPNRPSLISVDSPFSEISLPLSILLLVNW
jgi:hypothetical protein